MTNFILIIGLFITLSYAIYEQVIVPKRNGQTKLAIELQPQAKIDSWILIGLIGLTIAQGLQTGIQAFTLFLLGMSVILVVYSSFLRNPKLLLKDRGFFLSAFYIDYQRISQINLADKQKLVIDLTNGRRLFIPIKHSQDVIKVVNFFGGYK
ncbi:DUF986 domain-containing protein [Ursidibacter maritimus]|uniref:DUF986 family protein n=1 Tax=Ursidibacter maritimus TaxID=1331689 RepID=UPI001C46CFE8|nr:DUF986 family protein [Ursidibacter maritimus]MBV6541124.1 DUF986 domain-containing protein [Ursidibacter maritimus]